MAQPKPDHPLVNMLAMRFPNPLTAAKSRQESDGCICHEQRKRQRYEKHCLPRCPTRTPIRVSRNCHRSQQKPERCTASIAHEDSGGRPVQQQKPDACANTGHSQYPGRSAGHESDCRGGDRQLARGYSVDAVHEIHDVQQTDHPGDS
jgi:hypothetical protein